MTWPAILLASGCTIGGLTVLAFGLYQRHLDGVETAQAKRRAARRAERQRTAQAAAESRVAPVPDVVDHALATAIHLPPPRTAGEVMHRVRPHALRVADPADAPDPHDKD